MGIVRRQTIKNNLLSYLGVVIGVVSQLYIYPLNLEAKGFADGLIKFATLLYPFFTLGVGAVMVRFLPYVAGERIRAAAQLLTKSMLFVSAAILLLVGLAYVGGNTAMGYAERSGLNLGLLETHRWSIVFILTCLVYASILTTHLINYRRIAVPVLFNNLILKVSLPALVLALSYGLLEEEHFLLGILLSYAAIVGGLAAYALLIDSLRFDLSPIVLREKTSREMVSTAAYAVFGLLGSSVVTNMDVVMVNTTLSNVDTAIYSFSLFAAGVMAIPYAAMNTITAPIVAERWQQQDIDQLRQLYRDSSIALTAVGLCVFTGLLTCLPHLYFITEKMQQHVPGYWPTLLIAIGILADQVTSINSTLINYTDHYRWHVVFVVGAGIVNYALNYYYLVVLGSGLWGAAVATMISLILYNLAKSVFVYHRMGIQPLAVDHLRIVGVFGLAAALTYVLPTVQNAWIDIAVRGGLILMVAYLFFRFTGAAPLIQKALRDGFKSVF